MRYPDGYPAWVEEREKQARAAEEFAARHRAKLRAEWAQTMRIVYANCTRLGLWIK